MGSSHALKKNWLLLIGVKLKILILLQFLTCLMLDAEALWEICLLERKVMNINLGSDNIDIKVVIIQ